MTTVAYRDGVMAADSGSWMGNASVSWAKKVAKDSVGNLYGVSGRAACCSDFLHAVENGSDSWPMPKASGDDNDFIVLRVSPSGDVELWTAFGTERYGSVPYFAIGSGAPTAYGALFAGADARRAIEAAVEHGEGAQGPVQSVSWADR